MDKLDENKVGLLIDLLKLRYPDKDVMVWWEATRLTPGHLLTTEWVVMANGIECRYATLNDAMVRYSADTMAFMTKM
jgi:hypothetical protein